MNDIKKAGMIFDAVCCEIKTDLATKMWEKIDVISYLNDVFRTAYKVSAIVDTNEVLLNCVFEPLSKSFKQYELGLIGSANLTAQLITLYRNNDDVVSAEGLVKGLNLLDEISAIDSSVNFIELNFAVRMAIHKIEKLGDSVACKYKGEI
jgi:hypothetical protein